MRKSIAALVLAAGAIAAVAIASIACSGQTSGPTPAASAARAVATAMSPPYSSLANGRAIFMTGRDLRGDVIHAASPPLFGRCEACHAASGAGGRRFADGAVSADLRHRALVVEQDHPYTIALLERAISSGIDNDGHTLDKVMPRWRLSQKDLHDVAQYVLTLK